MKSLWKASLIASALVFSPFALAEETVTEAPAAAEAPVEGVPAPVVELSATSDQIVKVNTGNETLDAVSNLAVKCGERTAAFKACDSMGGFKAMGCRKVAEVRYKNVECPVQ